MVAGPQAAEIITCDSPKCKRQAMSWRGTGESFCSVCGIHLAPSQRAGGICAEPYCRQRLSIGSAAREKRRLKEKREELEFLAMSQWFATDPFVDSKQSETLSGASSHKQCPLPIVVPANLRPLTSPPEERVALLRENLVKLASVVANDTSGLEFSGAEYSSKPVACERETAEATEAEKADSNFDVLANHACGTCLGFCCFAGREHAFLKESDVRRTMLDKQIANAETAVEEFLSYIPEQTVEGSCLFHGPTGCGMPRRMRSDMCNTTLCPSLVHLYHKSARQAESQLYLFAATNLEDDLAPEPRVFALRVASLHDTAE